MVRAASEEKWLSIALLRFVKHATAEAVTDGRRVVSYLSRNSNMGTEVMAGGGGAFAPFSLSDWFLTERTPSADPIFEFLLSKQKRSRATMHLAWRQNLLSTLPLPLLSIASPCDWYIRLHHESRERSSHKTLSGLAVAEGYAISV